MSRKNQQNVVDIFQTINKINSMKIDTNWFKGKIVEKYGSLRQFSKMLSGRSGKTLDVAALSLMLRGKRSIQIDEAIQMSRLLNVPIIEKINKATGENF